MEAPSQSTFISMESLADTAIDMILSARFSFFLNFNTIVATKIELFNKIVEITIVPNTDMNIKQILQATDLPNFLNSNHLQKGVEYYIRAAIGITQINDVVFQIAPHLLPRSIIFYNGNDPNGDLPEQARANLFGAIWIPSNEISPNITNIATEYFLFKESLLEDRAQMEEMHRKWQKKVRQIEITKEKLEEEQKKNEAFKKQLENEEAKRREEEKKNEAFKKQLENEEAKRREEEQKSEKLKKQLEEEEKKSKELRKQLELEEAKRLEEERRCNEFKLKYEELQKRLAIEEERKKEVKRRKKEKKERKESERKQEERKSKKK